MLEIAFKARRHRAAVGSQTKPHARLEHLGEVGGSDLKFLPVEGRLRRLRLIFFQFGLRDLDAFRRENTREKGIVEPRGRIGVHIER